MDTNLMKIAFCYFTNESEKDFLNLSLKNLTKLMERNPYYEYKIFVVNDLNREDKLKKDGTPASKARAGKSIGENAPALLISMIEQKLNNYDNGILVKFDLTKEADFYDTLKNTEKWAEFVRSA